MEGAPVAASLSQQTPLWRHPAFGWLLMASGLLVGVLALFWGPASLVLTRLEFAIAEWLPRELIAGAAWFALPALGFAGGLLASLSPCILPLVPLNVAYIGAAEATGTKAVALSARFVLGAAAALAVLGLAGDLAGFLLVEWRGAVLVVAGATMLYLGLASVELLPMPFAGRSPGSSRKLGPIAAGAAFSLVTTPCASPLLAALLAASGAQGIPGLSVGTMAAFALGYTALVFVAGAFGGGLVARLRRRSFEAPRAAAGAVLVAAGGGFLLAGALWF